MLEQLIWHSNEHVMLTSMVAHRDCKKGTSPRGHAYVCAHMHMSIHMCTHTHRNGHERELREDVCREERDGALDPPLVKRRAILGLALTL